MTRIAKLLVMGILIAIATGCAHTIQITPSLDAIRAIEDQNKSDKNVGYYVSSIDKETEVVTPGGGGDKIKYYPYKETEAALNTILSKKFSRVYAVPSLSDSKFISEKDISYIFRPTIVTRSSSSSLLTWPPTDFTVELSCSAIDSNGNEIWKKDVSGTGQATFGEFKKDFGLAGRRAAENAFAELLKEIMDSNAF